LAACLPCPRADDVNSDKLATIRVRLHLLIQRVGLPNSVASKMRQEFQELAMGGVEEVRVGPL